MSMNAASLSSSTAIAEPMADMNMTPLIDVMLVLIIMLIITIPRQNHSVNLNLPSDGKANAQQVVVQIDVDFDNTITWNGAAVPSRAVLEQKLLSLAGGDSRSEVHLRANKLAAYKVVAGIMATAQRSGVVNIGVVGNELM
jgi:biopolymer transport protein ExbD